MVVRTAGGECPLTLNPRRAGLVLNKTAVRGRPMCAAGQMPALSLEGESHWRIPTAKLLD
jgi:hypothetical protein